MMAQSKVDIDYAVLKDGLDFNVRVEALADNRHFVPGIHLAMRNLKILFFIII